MELLRKLRKTQQRDRNGSETRPPDHSANAVLTLLRGADMSKSVIFMALIFAVVQMFEGPTQFIVWVATQAFLNPMETEAQKIVWVVMGYAFLCRSASQAFLFLFYLAHFKSGRLHYFFYIWTDYIFWKMQRGMDDMRMSFQVYGENSDDLLSKLIGQFLRYYDMYMKQDNFLNKLWGTVEAHKLRPMELTTPIIDYTNKDYHHPGEAKKLVSWAKSLQRTAKILMLIMVGVMIKSSGVPYLIIVALFIMHSYSGKTEVIRRKPKVIPPMDGIYYIRSFNFGILWEMSIGVCVNGVMHATYHATGDKCLYINGVMHTPTYVDIERDVVTWGGDPQMERPKPGSIVYALINRLGGQTTYKIDMEIVGRDMTWPKVTEPGESGSPIVMEENGMLKLVTLAGNHVTYQGKGTEFGFMVDQRIEHDLDMQKGVTHQIASYPGSGKTFRVIPKICKEFVADHKGVIAVAGPTRVVCKELYQSLMSQMDHGLVGAMVKALPRVNSSRARVIVVAHATLAQLLLDEHPITKKLRGLIIDESHVDDKSTEFLKTYATEMAPQGLTSWFLSATHPGQMTEGSNYHIDDIQLSEYEALQGVKKMIDEDNKRVLIFTAGIKGENGTTKLALRFKQYTPVVLNSKSYEREKKRLDDVNNRLIIATNIAECGMNAEVDVVIDLCKNFYYTHNNGVVQGVMSTIPRSSRIQRRGRVGRTKDGMYIYTEEPVMDYRMDTAESYDAHLMSRGLDWYTGVDNYPHDPGISRKQSSIAMDKSLPPRYISLLYNRLGGKRYGEDLSEAVNEWLNGTVKYEGCNNKNCKCKGSYTFWDERVHDELLALKTGDPIAKKGRFGEFSWWNKF